MIFCLALFKLSQVVIEVFYNIFTQVSPNIPGMSFVGWAGGASPGAEFDRVTGFPFTVGSHTVPLAIGSFIVPSASFHFGFNQMQTNVGMRWGLDTSAGTGDSFIRAPACGLVNWGTLTSINLPGNWVMAATIDDVIPVELQSYDIE